MRVDDVASIIIRVCLPVTARTRAATKPTLTALRNSTGMAIFMKRIAVAQGRLSHARHVSEGARERGKETEMPGPWDVHSSTSHLNANISLWICWVLSVA